jgi:Cu(I)/Ag(I) efflux system membrane fusion protein
VTDFIRTSARRAMIAGPVLLALGAAWWFTRGPAPAPVAAGHDHSKMVATTGGGPVVISAADARRIGVTFATATHATLHRDVQLAGEVRVDETRITAVTLKVDGVVERLHADFVGKVIRRGEPLLALYSPMLVSAQEELLVAMRLQSTLARGASDAAGSATDLVASARRRLENWDVDPADIAMVEEHGMSHRTLTLRAPASGTVIEKNVVAGQQVMAGQMLLRVADLSQVWVDGDVFEQDLPLVRVGQEVRVEFRALPNVTRTGRVVSFEPTLDPATRTARMRVVLSNPGTQLRPGMFATMHLVAAEAAATIVVPRGAVLSTGERSLVFVRRDDGRLEPRQVVVGLSDDVQVQVLRGLNHGDVVVASATFLVDAESNLGTAMGGMGDMPGMDMTAPKAMEGKAAPMGDMPGMKHDAPAAKPAAKAPMPDMPGMDHSTMPGMNHEIPAAKPAVAPTVRKPAPER